MSEKILDKNVLREVLAEALPGHDQASEHPSMAPQFTYVPPSHARALDPDVPIVEGMRGAGKSHWWAVLSSSEHRQYLSRAFPELRIKEGGLEVARGYGIGLPPDRCPGKDVMLKLQERFSARHIWQTIIAVNAEFPKPFPYEARKWTNMVDWVSKNPEEYEDLLFTIDETLHRSGTKKLILFDALDRLANSWESIRPLARDLFQLALDMRSFKSIRLKLFVRPDMLEDKEIFSFPDSSKLLAGKAVLTWRRVDLYALIFQCIGSADNSGEAFRKEFEKKFKICWEKDNSQKTWRIPKALRADDELQRSVFHAISGPAMGASTKRGFPYTWLPNHLIDGKDQVSPRSFIAALRHAVLQDDIPEDWPYALHYRGIQAGVQVASKIRVDEITAEDYPWVFSLMNPLRGNINVPCEPHEIVAIWKKNATIRKLKAETSEGETKLSPPHLEFGERGVLLDLEELGVIQILHDGRIQMPDVYRIAFGFGRRGGVRPLQ